MALKRQYTEEQRKVVREALKEAKTKSQRKRIKAVLLCMDHSSWTAEVIASWASPQALFGASTPGS
jgi:hypothetical protein